MAAGDFHSRHFDEGTLTKLCIFELYAREWLPVFLSRPKPLRREVHLFDFFTGPGVDSTGQWGSPLRLLKQLEEYRSLAGWSQVRIYAHFFDASAAKIRRLRATLETHKFHVPAVTIDVRALKGTSNGDL